MKLFFFVLLDLFIGLLSVKLLARRILIQLNSAILVIELGGALLVKLHAEGLIS